MTKFADQLLTDLMHEHGSTLAHTRPPVYGRHFMPRKTLLGAGATCLAVAATVGALTVGGGGTPAYALSTHPNGTVTLDVYHESGIAGINAKLRQLGDNVVVVPVGSGCPGIGSLPAPAVQAGQTSVSVQAQASSGGSVTVNAQGVPAGDILVVGAATSGNGMSLSGARLTSAPAPSCVSLPAPGSGGGTVTNSGGGTGTVTGSGGGSGTVTGAGGGSGQTISGDN